MLQEAGFRFTGIIFLLACLACAPRVSAQATGKLSGTVVDASTGEPLAGANIVIVGIQMGTATDAQGHYFVIGVPVGTYDVRATFVGFVGKSVRSVEINGTFTRELNFRLSPGAELDEIIVEYERPLLQKDAIGIPKVYTSEDIESLPVRGTALVAALQGGVTSSEGSTDLFIRGGREEEVTYFVDGVKVIGLIGIPQPAVQEQEMLIGSIPARYGDTQSGVISVSTKSGLGDRFFGSAEYITSEAVDPYGYNLGALSLGGPIVGDRLHFFIAAEGRSAYDDTPFAKDIFTLPEDDFEQLQERPQVIRLVDEHGNVQFARFPADIEPGTLIEDVEGQLIESELIRDGFQVASYELANASELFTASDFVHTAAKDSPMRSLAVQSKLHFRPIAPIRFFVGGAYNAYDAESYDPVRQLYARDRYLVEDRRTYRVFGTWRHHLSRSSYYELSADYSWDRYWQYPTGFSRDIEDVLFYGDVDGLDAAGNPTLAFDFNSTARRYFQVSDDGERYVRKYTDGSLPSWLGVYGLFALPGTGSRLRYQKWDRSQFRLSANATTQIGAHLIEFGGEFEQQTRRSYTVFPVQLARYYNDGNVEAGDGDAVEKYSELPFDVARSVIALDGADWYGYDYHGRNETDSQNLDAFASGDNLSVAPHQPIFFGVYVQDKIEYRDVVLNLGLRLDAFDNNTPILKNPYMTRPLVLGRSLNSLPPTIGEEFVVYFEGSQATSDVVGYRDRDGNYYDVNGELTDWRLRLLGGPVVDEKAPFSSIFEDYAPQLVFQPRIGVSLPITDQTLIFASYNVLAQRPTEWNYMPPTAWANAEGFLYPNSSLEREVTKQYELGLRRSLGDRVALQISGFHRTQKNKIGLRVVNAAPSSYTSFFNVDFATTKGATFELDLRRHRNVALRANYTLSLAQGTGSDALTSSQIGWRGSYFPDFIAPAGFDRRHVINIWVDYRLGEDEGPRFWGTSLFANTGFNLLGVFSSGNPYTQLETPVTTPIFNQINKLSIGGVNEAQMPWTTRLDLRLDRHIDVGREVSVTFFVWVQNVLDTDNIFGVYRGSGLPDSDGFLEGGDAEREILNALSAESYVFHYEALTSDPLGPPATGVGTASFAGPRAFGVPRRTRVGVRLSF